MQRLFWITVVLAFISTFIFDSQSPTFFQLAMGLISVNGFVKQLELKDTKVSSLIFSYPFLMFIHFFMGMISLNDFVKQLNLKDMKNNIIRWIGVVTGMFQKG